MSADRIAPDGVTITIPAGHPLLGGVVDDVDRATWLVADLVAVLRTDPVDLLDLRRRASELFEHAEILDSDVDDVLSEVAR
jgi:hypothetical protein